MADLHDEQGMAPQTGSINYLDGSVLLRPQNITGGMRIFAIAIVAVAVVLGAFALTNIANKVIFAAANEQKAIESVLANDPHYDFPSMVECAGMDENSCRANLATHAENLFDVPSTNDAALDVIKLNPGISGEQATALYVAGGKGVSGKQAVDTLFGSWRFDIDRTAGIVWRLRFADFTSGSPEAAIRTAMASQGLGEDAVIDAGLDEAGNTYRVGQFEKESGVYQWRISAINLSEIYSVSNLPSSAIYVGLRVTPAE